MTALPPGCAPAAPNEKGAVLRHLPPGPQAPLSSPVDDAHGQLRYVVEVVDLQINAEAETAQVGGRLCELCSSSGGGSAAADVM